MKKFDVTINFSFDWENNDHEFSSFYYAEERMPPSVEEKWMWDEFESFIAEHLDFCSINNVEEVKRNNA